MHKKPDAAPTPPPENERTYIEGPAWDEDRIDPTIESGHKPSRYDDPVWLQLCCAVIQNPSHQIGNGEFAVSSANKFYDEIQKRKEQEHG